MSWLGDQDIFKLNKQTKQTNFLGDQSRLNTYIFKKQLFTSI